MKKIFTPLLITLLFVTSINAQLVIDAGQSLRLDDGIYLNMDGNFQNNGIFSSDNQSFVKLLGGQQTISGMSLTRFGNLVIDGTNEKTLNAIVPNYIEVSNNLIFNAQKVILNNNDLVLLSNANVVNPDNQKFVVTNNIGRLVKKEVPTTDFLFPVGSTSNSYTPVTLNSVGVTDTFAVRIIDGVTPSDLTEVEKTYLIKAYNPSSAVADITLAWNNVNEASLFVPNLALMFQRQFGQWSLLPGTPGFLPNFPSTDSKYQATGVQFLSLATDSFIVRSSAPPTIISHPQASAICEGDSTSFSVSAEGIGLLTFQWQVNCSGTWEDINNGGMAPVYSGATDSILTLLNVPYSLNGCSFRCIVSTLGGSTISDPAVLTVFPRPVAFITGDTTICEGEFSMLTAGTGSSYFWSTGETTETITVFPVPPSGDYSVTVTNNNSCTNTAHTTVVVTANFTVTITSNFEPDNIVMAGQSVTFTAMPPFYDDYIFIIGDDTVQTGGGNTFTTSTLSSSFDHVVTVIAYVNDCFASDSTSISVKPLPNVFTPFDKDGKNDLFAKGHHIQVMNRWGQLLFEGIEGWDGTYNGKNVSPGTYFYVVTFNKDTQLSFTVKGSVLLISEND